MLEIIIFLIVFFSLALFFVPIKLKHGITLGILSTVVIISSYISITALSQSTTLIYSPILIQSIQLPSITIDNISALFILTINFTMLTGLLYGRNYLSAYILKKSATQFSLHYFSYFTLYLSMLLVCTIRDGFSFLIVWEIMSLSSFLLVIFDAEARKTMKAGINYLIQMHVGFVFLLIGFMLLEDATGSGSFNNLTLYFSNHNNLLLFALFFVGFGIKAGFFPLHTWLPLAHPEAPSHVSGIMSGVMIKMGIFGILRLALALQSQLIEIGSFMLIISVVTGVVGILFATSQTDIKRILAYSSIENIGIIGIGISIGIIGKALKMPLVETLGYTGAMLHVINHSLFKSLLFYLAGSIYKATHTRNIEKLGGLIKKMPYSALLFLLAVLAISGLPPFNGFISEYLIYSAMFKSILHADFYSSALMLGGILGLALIGGLALFTFTRAFGIIFLGSERSDVAQNTQENNYATIGLFSCIGVMILAIGIFPSVILNTINKSLIQSNQVALELSTNYYQNLTSIGLLGGILILIITLILVWRSLHLKRINLSEHGPTWGCGYTAGTAKHQYTGTSFSDNIASLAQPILQSKKEMIPIEEMDIFPKPRIFVTRKQDVVRKKFIELPIDKMLTLFKKLAVMQTGQIQHYILYAFVYMLILLVLTILNIL